MKVQLVSKSLGVGDFSGASVEEIIVGKARVSSSREINELFTEPDKLLGYCLLQQHWSVFSMANLGFEIITSRAMVREIIRHMSMFFQEVSQRYAEITDFEPVELRKQADKNRQSSLENCDNLLVIESADLNLTAKDLVDQHIKDSEWLYRKLLEAKVSRETARFILPECTQSKIYVNGNIRSWLSFLNQRLHKTAQKEVRLVANAVRDIFIQECPIISKMMYYFEDAEECHIFERLVLEKYGVYELIRNNGFKKL